MANSVYVRQGSHETSAFLVCFFCSWNRKKRNFYEGDSQINNYLLTRRVMLL